MRVSVAKAGSWLLQRCVHLSDGFTSGRAPVWLRLGGPVLLSLGGAGQAADSIAFKHQQSCTASCERKFQCKSCPNGLHDSLLNVKKNLFFPCLWRLSKHSNIYSEVRHHLVPCVVPYFLFLSLIYTERMTNRTKLDFWLCKAPEDSSSVTFSRKHEADVQVEGFVSSTSLPGTCNLSMRSVFPLRDGCPPLTRKHPIGP